MARFYTSTSTTRETKERIPDVGGSGGGGDGGGSGDGGAQSDVEESEVAVVNVFYVI